MKKNKKFDLGTWVPPDPVIHQMKIMKELAIKGEEAKFFVITRWLNFESRTLHNLYFDRFPNMNIRDPYPNYLEYDLDKNYSKLMVLKIYFPVTKDLDFKNFADGFKNKEQRVFPRLGINLPDKIYVNFSFPIFGDIEKTSSELQKSIIDNCKKLDILKYVPSRLDEESRKIHLLLTNKNWEVLTTEIDNSELTEYVLSGSGYFTPETLAKENRKEWENIAYER